MNIVYDDDSSIAEFKIYEYLGTVLDTAIHNNGDGEAILSCAGISSLIPQYQKMLTPYSYNGQWQNNNVQYNPGKFFIEVFPVLDEKHRFLFIKAIVERANFYGLDEDFQPYYDAEQTAAHQHYYVLSGWFQCAFDPDGFFFEEPLEVEDGNIKLYIYGTEIGYTSDDPDNVRNRPYMMGFLEEEWSAPEDYEYGVSAYDGAGNLLVDATRIVDIPTSLSIAYIEAEDALYVDGTLYYRQK